MINVLILANGQQIGSGKNGQPAIQSCTVTQSVNADRELTPGSACSACLEAKIITTDRRLSIPVGPDNSVILMREDGTQVGVFVPERPVQLTANTYKLVAYDNVSRLDKDLSGWLKALDGWPYTLKTFAGMVAEACGVELVVEDIPNGSFNVQKFYQAGVTGRQILRWVGEMACRYLYADPEGKLRFGWYADRGRQILPTGKDYYFAGALKYEDYKVAAVDDVKVRLSGTDGGLLWPDGAAENPYVVSGNPITLAKVDGSLPSHLGAILRELLALPEYRPCKVSVPADRDIRVGDIVTVEDICGVRFRTLVMTRTVTGQKQTLECTGAASRGSATAANNKTPGQIAQEAVDRQSQKDIFNKLTDRGKAQGMFLGEDGNVYVNASWITAGVLASTDGKTFYLDLTNGILKMQAAELSISGKTVEEIAGDAASGATDGLTQKEIFDKLTGGGSDQGLYLSGEKLYLNASYIKTGTLSASNISGGTLDASKMSVSNMNAGSITTGRLKSSGGGTYFDLGTGQIVCDSRDLKVVISGGEVRLYNGTGKQVAMVSADSSNGCLKLYDKDGTERLGITASAQGPLVTLWDASLQREVSSPVCFREVGGVKVIAVGTYGTA